MAEPRTWSFSSLDDYRSCAFKYRLKRVDRVPARHYLNASGGTAFHRWADSYDFHRLAGDDIDPWDECLELAVAKDEEKSKQSRDQFSISGRGKETFEYWRDELGPELCSKYIEWWDNEGRDYVIPIDLPPDVKGNTIGIEYAVECMFGDTPYRGFVDRILVNSQDVITVVDIKAGARKQYTVQLPSYKMAARKNSINATSAAIYDARKGALDVRGSFANYTDEALAGIYDTAREQEARGEYPPSPSENCGWCSVRDYCQYRLK